MPPVIPSPDPGGLPAPPVLIVFLMLLTFTLHLLAMNFLVGGSLMQFLALRRAKDDPFFGDLAKKIGAALPVTMSLTITLGVAPLLFVQLLYGQAFYTSTVLMAWPWLSIIALLMAAYYGIYALRFRPEWLGGGVSLLAGLVTLLVLAVGVLQTMSATLVMLPGKWATMYKQSALGFHLNLTDPTLIPRYLHFMVGGVAIAGIGIILLAAIARKTEHKWSERAMAYGARWFIFGTIAQVVVGIVYLFTLPQHIRQALLGGSSLDTGLLAAGIVAALLAMPFIKRMPAVGSVLAVAAIAIMSVVRHRVRDLTLAPDLNVYSQQVNPQWALFLAFAVILVLGLATVAWMVVQFAKAQAPHHAKETK